MILQELQQKKFNDQFLFFENYQENNLLKIKIDLKNYFETIDQEIFNSSWRKDNGYIPDGFKSRTILTIFGPITYKRRVYKYWKQNSYHYVFLTDKKLEIEKYSRITNHLKFKILEQTAQGKRQRDIYDSINHANITTATIGNIIKSFNLLEAIKKIIYNQKRVFIVNYLYINMDETYIKLRCNNKITKYRIRLITFHTGYDETLSTKKRKVLANKRVYWQIFPISQKINTKEFIENIKKIAKLYYHNIENCKIIIGGDGAPWIRESSIWWGNSYYLLDKFHAYRHLKKFFYNEYDDKNIKKYQVCKKFFTLGQAQQLIKYLKNNEVNSSLNKEKQIKLGKIINYFKHNAVGISNQKYDFNIGVSAEGDISHIIKWLLGYGSKTFNYQTFKNMLFLRTAEINQIDIINYLKNEYQQKQKLIKYYYWNNYWFKKNYYPIINNKIINKQHLKFF